MNGLKITPEQSIFYSLKNIVTEIEPIENSFYIYETVKGGYILEVCHRLELDRIDNEEIANILYPLYHSKQIKLELEK